MSAAENKRVSRRWHEAWGTPELQSAYAECLAPDFRALFFGMGWVDRNTYLERDQEFLRGFSEVRITVEDAVAEEDAVMCRMTWRGMHSREVAGLAATGARFEIMGFAIDRFRDGMVVEHVPLFDQLGLYVQLGLIKDPLAEPAD